MGNLLILRTKAPQKMGKLPILPKSKAAFIARCFRHGAMTRLPVNN